jgi:hypothetical protein
MVPGGFKRFPNGEKAQRVQDRRGLAVAGRTYEPNAAHKPLDFHRIF